MGTTEDITLACTAEQYLVELRRQSKQAGELIAGLTVAQFNWQPNAGRSWSIAQCLEHLTATNQVYLAAIRPAVQSSRGSQAEIVWRMAHEPVYCLHGASTQAKVSGVSQDPAKALAVPVGGSVIPLPLRAGRPSEIRIRFASTGSRAYSLLEPLSKGCSVY